MRRSPGCGARTTLLLLTTGTLSQLAGCALGLQEGIEQLFGRGAIANALVIPTSDLFGFITAIAPLLPD